MQAVDSSPPSITLAILGGMTQLSSQELIQIVLDSFKAEETNDIEWGKRLIGDDFLRVSMTIHGDNVFPRLEGTEAIESALKHVYSVRGREFHVWNTAVNVDTQTVFVELAEIEPINSKTTVWPYTLVCEIRDKKIVRTRHYGDPRLLDADISIEDVRLAIEK